MTQRQTELTDEQWAKIAPLIPEPEPSPNGGPWPVANRPCFEGILWVLRSGARWKDLPKGRFPSASTCWRRLREWERLGIWLKVWRAFLAELNEKQQLKWSESFLDGSFAPAKKGARESAKPSGARGRSGWYWSTVKVFRWGFGWKVPLRQKLHLRKPRSPKSAFRGRRAVHGKSPSA